MDGPHGGQGVDCDEGNGSSHSCIVDSMRQCQHHLPNLQANQLGMELSCLAAYRSKWVALWLNDSTRMFLPSRLGVIQQPVGHLHMKDVKL